LKKIFQKAQQMTPKQIYDQTKGNFRVILSDDLGDSLLEFAKKYIKTKLISNEKKIRFSKIIFNNILLKYILIILNLIKLLLDFLTIAQDGEIVGICYFAQSICETQVIIFYF